MSKKVLIIEDELVLQDVYKIILTSGGYEVYTANNGLEGLSILKSAQPQLVLLDLFMPVMDGREFLRNVDSVDCPSTKIVVYSNLSNRETEQEMIDLGAHKFILKSSMAPKDLLKLASDMTSLN